MKDRTKRVVDWLTLLPLGLWVAMGCWSALTDNKRAPLIAVILAIGNIPFVFASLIWLSLRFEKIPIANWFFYNVARYPLGRFVSLVLLAFLTFFVLWSLSYVRWLLR